MSTFVKEPQNGNPTLREARTDAGAPIPKKLANELLRNFLDIKGDFTRLSPSIPELPGVNTTLLRKLFDTDWNGFAFSKKEVLRLFGMSSSPGDENQYLLVLMGADQDTDTPPDIIGYPTIILAGTTSEDQEQFTTLAPLPSEHPPKVFVSEIRLHDELIFTTSK